MDCHEALGTDIRNIARDCLAALEPVDMVAGLFCQPLSRVAPNAPDTFGRVSSVHLISTIWPGQVRFRFEAVVDVSNHFNPRFATPEVQQGVKGFLGHGV